MRFSSGARRQTEPRCCVSPCFPSSLTPVANCSKPSHALSRTWHLCPDAAMLRPASRSLAVENALGDAQEGEDPPSCFTGRGKGCLDGAALRIADGVAIATLGGTSAQWHRRHMIPRAWQLIGPLVLLIVSFAIGNHPLTITCRGLDILAVFLYSLGDSFEPLDKPPQPPMAPPSPYLSLIHI